MQQTSQNNGFHLKGVTVRFGSTVALRDINIELKDGERVGLVGPSGSGKTTLLRLLNGAVRPTEGDVNIHGQHVTQLSARQLRQIRSQIGFIPQDLSLVPNLRVIQNVLSGRLGKQSLTGALRSMLLPKQSEKLEAYRILERVGINEKLYQRTDHLSGGQQQRVAIARALYQNPIALLADEPVSSVDPARARDTVQLLTQISEQQNLTLCMSLHTLELARNHFPRLIGLRNGAVVFDQPTSDISDDAFAALYQLTNDELLEDGVPTS